MTNNETPRQFIFEVGCTYLIESIYSKKTHAVTVAARTTDTITLSNGRSYPVKVERERLTSWEVAQVTSGMGRNAFISSETANMTRLVSSDPMTWDRD
jgi:hypothetical protein